MSDIERAPVMESFTVPKEMDEALGIGIAGGLIVMMLLAVVAYRQIRQAEHPTPPPLPWDRYGGPTDEEGMR